MNSCFDCQTRGQLMRSRGRRRRKHVARQSCQDISDEFQSNTVVCSNGCMAAHGVFSNGDESVERWCVDSDRSSDIKALFSYVGSDSRKFRETKDGMKYVCNSVFFDDETGMGIRSYNYCWCQGDRCNGNAINGFIRSGGTCVTERVGAGAIGLVIALSIMVLAGVTTSMMHSEKRKAYSATRDDSNMTRKIGNCNSFRHMDVSFTITNFGRTEIPQQRLSLRLKFCESPCLVCQKYVLPVTLALTRFESMNTNTVYGALSLEGKCGCGGFNLNALDV